MALSDRKIPIIAGRNDTPTTSQTEANHPNGSFLISKYNALIDDLDVPLNYNTIQAYPVDIYVNATTGNDITGNGSLTNPFATIQKAIDMACQDKIVFASIQLRGVFTNPKLDFSNYYCLFSDSYFDGWQPEAQWFRQAGLWISVAQNNGEPIDPNTKIVLNEELDTANSEFTNIPYSFIYSPNSTVHFQNILFDIVGSDHHNLINSNIHFTNCTFNYNPTDIETWTDAVLHCFKSSIWFDGCIFNYGNAQLSNNVNNAINTYECVLFITNNTFNTNGVTNVFYKCRNSVLNIPNYPTGIDLSALMRCTIFINFNGTDTASTLSIDENKNVVKECGFIF